MEQRKTILKRSYKPQKPLESPELDTAPYCAQCSYQADWPFQLEYHIQKNHRNVGVDELHPVTEEPELYFCIYCGFKSYYKLHLYEHSQRQHDAAVKDESQLNCEIIYPCDCGEYKSHSGLSLVKHHDSHGIAPIAGASFHFEDDPKQNNVIWMDSTMVPKRFHCAKCPYKGKTKSSLKQHIMLKHARAADILWFDCTKCSYRGKLKGLLKRHMLTHGTADDTNWFGCAKCSYRTKYKSSLKRHMKTHATTEWYDCTTCAYRAKEKLSVLKHHMLRHGYTKSEGLACYNCTECSYRSMQRSKLNRHMLTHVPAEEIKWFDCGECPYRSNRKDTLKTHIMLVHAKTDDVKWFRCNECSYQARAKRNFKRHMLTHTANCD